MSKTEPWLVEVSAFYLFIYLFLSLYLHYAHVRDQIWYELQFYAPWCEYCKTLEPIWYDVASELKSQGSDVNVGKMDTTVYSGESNPTPRRW